MVSWKALVGATLWLALISGSSAFVPQTRGRPWCTTMDTSPPTVQWSSPADETVDPTSDAVSDLEAFILKEYSAFHALLAVNEGLWNTLALEVATGLTLFAPSNAAFDALGERKLQQLKDSRNQETIVKMGLYHIVITEAVSAARLRTEDWTVPKPKDGRPRPITVQGLVTLGGEVPVGRLKSGGGFLSNLLGGGDTEGDVVIGPSGRIVKSYKLGGGSIIVHEMDSLISPELLWRYCDQLRIPGF